MKLNIKTIAGIAGQFMSVTKDLPKQTLEYLNTRSQLAYSKLETTLKAAGYTVTEYFNSLADYSSDIEFIDSFRNVSALAAKIEIIQNSTDMSDAEKCAELDKIFEQQKQQENVANDELHKKRKDHLKAVVATGAIIGGVVVATHDEARKIAGNAIKAIAKK